MTGGGITMNIMKKTLLRIGSACGLAMLFFGSSSVHAFCTEFDIAGIGVNCVGEGHKLVTGAIKPILRPEIWSDIWNGNYSQDDPFGDFAGDGQRHFESCRFATDGEIAGSTDYIRDTYHKALSYLNPADPDPVSAANNFGKLLHTVQDFYSHSNWINLLNISAPTPVNPTHLIDNTTGEWRLLSPLSIVQDDIIVGQIPTSGLPGGWQVEQELTSETPFFMTNEGSFLRGLIVGWNSNGACPDVREGTTIDEYSHVKLNNSTGEVTQIPRNLKLTHGESKIAGRYDLDIPLLINTYQETRPCHDGYPTYVCLQKDHPGRPDYGQAIHLAEYQTAHEWCRLLQLAKDSQYGYAASSILMTLWAKPHDEPVGPDPITTSACGTPPEVLAGKPGPIEVTVDPDDVYVNHLPVPDVPVGRTAVFAVYTGDFRRSISRQGFGLTDDSRVRTDSITLCVKPTDRLVATIWGWDDFDDDPFYPTLSPTDRILRGPTWVLDGPGFQPPEDDQENQDMYVGIDVTVGGADPDGDGLSTACGETFYGTDPLDADSDDDGLTDGAEVNTYGTDPLDADSDDDGLTDGAEVNTYGTDPLDADSDDDGLTDDAEVNTYGTDPLDVDTDDDGLTDGEEVDTYGTDPLDADTDDDGLSDSQELDVGTNPLNPDTDGDGLLDGQDVDWIEDAILAIPEDAIQSSGKKGNRNAMLNLLADAEAHLRRGNIKPALDKITTLRSRIDGCGSSPDSNDWITDCAEQVRIRQLLDILIANL